MVFKSRKKRAGANESDGKAVNESKQINTEEKKKRGPFSIIRGRSSRRDVRSSSRSAGNVERLDVTRERGSSLTRSIGRAMSKEQDYNQKIVQFDEFGDNATKVNKIITTDGVPDPSSPDHVIVKVKASTISLKDCNIRRGMWYESISLPCTPGFDLVGTIVSLGDNVKKEGRLQEGDPVAACCRTGGNSRYCNLPGKDLIKVPGSVDSAQAACIVNVYMSAYQVLHRVVPRNEKETLEGITLLITGGNGPVGQAVIELATRAGASEIYATADEKYHDSLRAKGAIPLPLDHDEWLPVVKGNMDVVIDGICQDSYESPRAALKKTGHLVTIGMTLLMKTEERGWFGMPMSAMYQSFKSNYLMSQTSTYCPWKSSQTKPEEWKHDLEYLFGLLQRGKIRPKVAKRVTLEAVPSTQKKLEQGNFDGIPVCKPWK